MDSVDALDLLEQCWNIFRQLLPANTVIEQESFLARMKEQIRRHKRALRFVIDGSHDKEDSE